MAGFFAGQNKPAPVATKEMEEEGKIPRDRWDRPMIWLPDGSKRVAYARASSYGGQLEDKSALEKWGKRQMLRGAAINPSIIERVPQGPARERGGEVGYQDKKTLDRLVEQADEAVGSQDKAALGTAIHYGTEVVDLGGSLADLTPLVRNRADAYYRACREAGLVMTSVEQFGVEDVNQVAGTWDRLGYVPFWPGKIQRVLDVKGLDLDTELATPSGWTTMRHIQVGDHVFGPDGRPTRVTLKSSAKQIGTYVVTFDDGAKITCDSEHIWWTECSVNGKGEPRARSIQEIIATLRSPRGQAWHRVPVARPLELPEVNLPLDPYLFGCWLGDGAASKGVITKEADLFDIIESDGMEIMNRWSDKRRPNVVTASFAGLTSLLRSMGVLNDKHIPPDYLRASVGQRTRLLQGLMDTDGSWNTARDRAQFSTTDLELGLAVLELVRSLGQRAVIKAIERTGFGNSVMAYDVEFTPIDLAPFRLPRKVAKVREKLSSAAARRRIIVSVEPGPDVETACIAVDNATHVYLAGGEMIPTHNTSGSMDFAGIGFAVQLAEYAHMKRYDPETGGRVPHDTMDLEQAIIIHVDREMDGPVSLHRVDIAAGWRYSQLAREVILARRVGTKVIQDIDELEIMIGAATSHEELVETFESTGAQWTTRHRELASTVAAQLRGLPA